MVSKTTDSAVGLRRQELEHRAAGRIRTGTEWFLEPPTLPLVYGGMVRAELASLRRPESHRRGLAYETWLRTRTLPAQAFGGNAGTCTQLVVGRLLYRQPRSGFTVNAPLG